MGQNSIRFKNILDIEIVIIVDLNDIIFMMNKMTYICQYS